MYLNLQNTLDVLITHLFHKFNPISECLLFLVWLNFAVCKPMQLTHQHSLKSGGWPGFEPGSLTFMASALTTKLPTKLVEMSARLLTDGSRTFYQGLGINQLYEFLSISLTPSHKNWTLNPWLSPEGYQFLLEGSSPFRFGGSINSIFQFLYMPLPNLKHFVKNPNFT